MPLKKISFKPGINRENTRYTTEGGWYDCNNIRFRQGTPEKIGGVTRLSTNLFGGVARSLWAWVTLDAVKLLGVGTNSHFYIYSFANDTFYDITPVDRLETLTNPFTTTAFSHLVEVSDPAGGYSTLDRVAFYPTTSLNGLDIYGDYSLSVLVPGSTYEIYDDQSASASGNGGGTVYAMYYLPIGPGFVAPQVGWGSGGWGFGPWGVGVPTIETIRLWSQGNFGEDLVFAPRGGKIYYWDASYGLNKTTVSFSVTTPTVVTANYTLPEGGPIIFVPADGATMPTPIIPGQLYYVRNVSGTQFNISLTPSGALEDVTVGATGNIYMLPNGYALENFSGASDVPTIQNLILVSDINRFVFAFGANDYGSTKQDQMLIRWSDQDDPYNWTPAATNQAGFLRLSRGSKIVAVIQSRQEILVWTDCALYSLQYVGAPIVWGAQLLADNISIAGQNCVAFSNGIAYWMGKGKFYKYDGRVSTLRCDVRKYVFNNFDTAQYEQVVGGTIEQFNEIWWYYVPLQNQFFPVPYNYVVYNYAEDIWYYGVSDYFEGGTRTAWLDVGLWDYPITTNLNAVLLNLEDGVDNNWYYYDTPLVAWIVSSQFDLDDGQNFMFVWRVLPDLTFDGSTASNPTGVLNLLPLRNSGSGFTPGDIYYDPLSFSVGQANNSVANDSYANVTQTVSAVPPVEGYPAFTIAEFTGQVYTRIRGRQISVGFMSSDLGVTWQLGSMRIDMKPDGRR